MALRTLFVSAGRHNSSSLRPLLSPSTLLLEQMTSARRSRQTAAEAMEASTSTSVDQTFVGGEKGGKASRGRKSAKPNDSATSSAAPPSALGRKQPSAAAQAAAASTAPPANPGYHTMSKTIPIDLIHEVEADGTHVFKLQASPAAVEDKPRLDALLTSSIPAITRSKILHCIKDSLVTVNGKPITKGGHKVRPGDLLICKVPPPPPIEAIPEAIPLDVVYEDAHLMMVNKPNGMVVHPAPGLSSGTLVNALLHHCDLPAMRFVSGNPPLPKSLGGAATSPAVESGLLAEDDVGIVDEEGGAAGELEDGEEAIEGTWAPLASSGPPPVIRPGIVHRIDKGTTGLLVVSKDDQTHAGLCKQFETRTTHRLYWSITVGVPKDPEGRIQTNIDRDPRDFRRMTWLPSGGNKGKHAASNFKVLEVLAGGGAALVQWKLETGRTHQIRVHAKYVGHPLLGDETYGGAGTGAAQVVARGGGAAKRAAALEVIKQLGRPALHAKTLAFTHPATQQAMSFDSEPPEDFLQALEKLRALT